MPRCDRNDMRGVSRIEVLVMLIGVAVLATALLHRLADVSTDARRVQLRMAAENVRINAALLQLRCGNALDPACWQRVLASTQRAALVQGQTGMRAEPVIRPPGPATAIERLRTVALAAGLGEHRGSGPAWVLQPQGDAALRVGLADVPDCRFLLHWVEATASAEVQAVEDRC